MKVFTIIAAFLAAAVMAAPTPDTEAEPAIIDKRQSWCGKCEGGARICCSQWGCSGPNPC